MGGDDDVAKAESEGLADVENTVFVAVGKSFKHSKTTLFWASRSFPGKIICLLHVHQPPHLFTFMEERFSVTKVKKMVVKSWREVERRKMHKLLNQYLVFLGQLGVQACKVWIEEDNIEKGIVRVIDQYNVRRLVMGAAADEHHTKNLSELKSKKAIFVCEQAPDSCHIWFTCDEHLIYARCGDGSFHLQGPITFPSSTSGSNIKLLHANADKDSDEQGQITLPSSTSGSNIKLLHENADEDSEEQGQITLPSEPTSQHLVHSTQPTEELVEECENLNKTKQTQDLEKSLDRQRQELVEMKDEYDNYVKELQMISDQKLELESQLTDSKSTEEELEEKIIQAVKLLVSFKEKRDKLQIERDNLTGHNEELQKLVAGNSESLSIEFSFWEINEATKDFDPFLKIRDGAYGCVYKGFLHHLKVAIKMLPCHGCQGRMDFMNKTRFLFRMRHPNIVTVMGTCPEPRSLIYEYLENGSLEDRLICQGKTTPLSWKTRIKIASEICTALVFLHSNKPAIIHGNLKATNVLLDVNFVSKISDVGIHCLVPNNFQATLLTSLCNGDDLEASAYVAPEVFETGEFTPGSDLYSFGVVLLRLLTGRPAVGVLKNVKCALEMGNCDSVLDLTAGKWPIELAKKLARLALRCCELELEHRADLVSDVVREIDLMKTLCDSSDSDAKGLRRVPSHFICPIFQEVMKDPQIAPDGFTYEGDAIKGWFNSGHDTSPMTNMKLECCDLLPNYAIYYAIQEWEQQN